MRVDCPHGGYIELPEEWLGGHAERRDKALEKAGGFGPTLRNFAACMAVLENWELPGLPGNPAAWDFEQVPLPLMLWINKAVNDAYLANFTVSKKKQ